MKKRCTKCGIQKLESQFSKKTGRQKQPWCKPCVNTYDRFWYRKNKNKKLKNMRAYSKKVRKQLCAIVEYEKTGKPCMDCKRSFHPCAMDFDHRNPTEKVLSICKLKFQSVSKNTLKAEISKCDLVCANCHRIRTYKRRLGLSLREELPAIPSKAP